MREAGLTLGTSIDPFEPERGIPHPACLTPADPPRHSLFCILYSVFWILYSVFCILYSVFCILDSGFWILNADF
ncbi:MAG: hypothetical protein AMJ59_18240 [Gammaproteobacteria bacterium SG8_31]|nr:MAG: hypothetical protein AMJ59_18240 [Gammaproteobacteria bacterium SG8_31]